MSLSSFLNHLIPSYLVNYHHHRPLITKIGTSKSLFLLTFFPFAKKHFQEVFFFCHTNVSHFTIGILSGFDRCQQNYFSSFIVAQLTRFVGCEKQLFLSRHILRYLVSLKKPIPFDICLLLVPFCDLNINIIAKSIKCKIDYYMSGTDSMYSCQLSHTNYPMLRAPMANACPHPQHTYTTTTTQ